MDEYPCESTMDYVDALGRQARGDLQRLWEDGRVIRYKCPEIAIEFGHGTVTQWFWATVEEVLRWEQEDAEYKGKLDDDIQSVESREQ